MTMDIRHFFAKRNGNEVLEQGPSISNEIDSNSETLLHGNVTAIFAKEKERLMKNGNVVFKWLTLLLLRILEIPGSILGPGDRLS
jgi:hypothetical protein